MTSREPKFHRQRSLLDSITVKTGFLIDRVLGLFDNEEREWVVRRRIWMIRNFPHRTCEIIFPSNEDDLEDWDGVMEFGNYTWHWPERWRKR